MSPRTGRPTLNKKTERFEVRMTADEAADLQYCSDMLQITKTEVVKRGVQLVKTELENKK